MPSQDGATVIVTGVPAKSVPGICEVFVDQGANLAVWISTAIVPSSCADVCRELAAFQLDITDNAAVDAASTGSRRISGRVGRADERRGMIRVGDPTR